jgi:RNA polymerase sigma factor (sigma-70 family)
MSRNGYTWNMVWEQAVPGAPTIRWTPRRLLPAGDERLAQLVRSGSEDAFAALYGRYHQRLYRYCRSLLGNDNDAQDALQSTFANAFAALAKGRREAPVRPWLYRIAHNESISILRRRGPEVEISEQHLRPAPSAAEVAGQHERLASLTADLRELTERQRAALVLRELGGLSHAEIASVLAIDAAGAKQTIFEARRSLQEFAEGRAMVCDEVCRSISGGGGRAMRGRRIKAHLRDCNSCRAFAEAIPSRARELRVIAPPLAGTAATSILRRALASAPGHSGSSGVGIAAGTAGKAAAALTAGKALAGAAAVLTVAAGATGVVRALGTHPARRAAMVTRANGSTQHGAAHFRLQAIAPSDRSNRPMAEKVARTRPSRGAQKSGVAVRHRERGAGRSRSLMRGHANAGQAHSRGRTGSTRIRPQHTRGQQAKTRTGAISGPRGRGVSTTTTRTSSHRQTDSSSTR